MVEQNMHEQNFKKRLTINNGVEVERERTCMVKEKKSYAKRDNESIGQNQHGAKVYILVK